MPGFTSQQMATTYSKLSTLRQRMLQPISRLQSSRGRRLEQYQSVSDRAWWKRRKEEEESSDWVR
jgi:hypothetical protein